MILVTTGSSGAPFDRLLRVIERLEVEEELVVQHGPSAIRPPGATCFDFLPFHQLDELVETARKVVAHAGAGSILLCASHGRVPIVVPRLARYGEVVDDHQLFLARRLHTAGTVVCAEDPEDLPGLIAPNVLSAPAAPRTAGLQLVKDLREYVDAVLG
jgi:UDP-N-acetylglucosamine transferase subunit ALG13